MPVLWLAIVQFLTVVALPLILKVLKGIGFGFVAYAGASAAVSQFQAYIFSNYNNMPASVFAIITLAGFDVGMKMVFAAYVAKIALSAGAKSITYKDYVT